MTTIYKDEMFDRLYNYFKNYDKLPPTTYEGFLTLPQTKMIMDHCGNDPYRATLNVLFNSGRFSDDDIIEYDNKMRGWVAKLANTIWNKPLQFVNKILNDQPPESFINAANRVLNVDILT